MSLKDIYQLLRALNYSSVYVVTSIRPPVRIFQFPNHPADFSKMCCSFTLSVGGRMWGNLGRSVPV
jgi:hypothetical protein